jgi:hypothetical protein
MGENTSSRRRHAKDTKIRACILVKIKVPDRAHLKRQPDLALEVGRSTGHPGSGNDDLTNSSLFSLLNGTIQAAVPL